MGHMVPFGGGRTPKPPSPQTIVDKLQIILLEWPEAGREFDKLLTELLTLLRTRG